MPDAGWEPEPRNARMGAMKKFMEGPGGQLLGLICMSFGAGVLALTAFERFLRGDAVAWLFAIVTVVFCCSIFAVALRFRKTIP
jgi:hypothetical protein